MNENLIQNMITWAEAHLGKREYLGWVPLERVLAQREEPKM